MIRQRYSSVIIMEVLTRLQLPQMTVDRECQAKAGILVVLLPICLGKITLSARLWRIVLAPIP